MLMRSKTEYKMNKNIEKTDTLPEQQIENKLYKDSEDEIRYAVST
jgi:hypothetical protein